VDLPNTLEDFTLELIGDLKALRQGRISVKEARARAMLAREVLRAVHLQLEGMRYLSEAAKEAGIAKQIEQKG